MTTDNFQNPKNVRSAYSSILGYLYQFKVTLYHILLDIQEKYPYDEGANTNWKYLIEDREDYKRITNHNSIHMQIKHHQSNTDENTYYKPILALYKNFIEKDSNSSYYLGFFDECVKADNLNKCECILTKIEQLKPIRKANKRDKGKSLKFYSDERLQNQVDEVGIADDNYKNYYTECKSSESLLKELTEIEKIQAKKELFKNKFKSFNLESKEDIEKNISQIIASLNKEVNVEFCQKYLLASIIDKYLENESFEFNNKYILNLINSSLSLDYSKILNLDIIDTFERIQNTCEGECEDNLERKEQILELIKNISLFIEESLKNENNIKSLLRLIYNGTQDYSSTDKKIISDCFKESKNNFISMFIRIIDLILFSHSDIDDIKNYLNFENDSLILKLDKDEYELKEFVVLYKPQNDKNIRNKRELINVIQRFDDKENIPKTWLFDKVQDCYGNKFRYLYNQACPDLIDSAEDKDIFKNINNPEITVECFECFNSNIINIFKKSCDKVQNA